MSKFPQLEPKFPTIYSLITLLSYTEHAAPIVYKIFFFLFSYQLARPLTAITKEKEYYWSACTELLVKNLLTIFLLITSCTFARQVRSLSLRGIPSKTRDVKFSVTAKHSLMALQNSQSECLNCWSFINNETKNVKINQWHKLISSKNWQFYKVFSIKGGLNILTVVQRSITFISELAFKLKLKLESAVELLDGVAMITWCTGKTKGSC